MKLTTNSGVTPAWWGRTICRLVAASILVAMTLAMPKPARAGRLGTDIIALFPKEIGEFAYADLKKARTLKWFPQLQEQMLPDRFRQFEKFLASAGVDPNSQVEELAWGLVAEGMTAKTEGVGSTDVPTGEEIVGVALGTYNPNSTEAFFKQQKLSTFKSRGYTLYAFGTGSGANDLFFFYRFEYRGVWSSRGTGKDDRGAVWERGRTVAQRQTFAADQRSEWQRRGVGGVESGLHATGDAATGAGSATVPRSGETRRPHAKHDYQRGSEQRHRRKVPGGMRIDRGCEHAGPVAAGGIPV